MEKDSLKDNWENLGDYIGGSKFSNMSLEQFIKSRSGTIYSKIRNTVITDLVIKSVFAVVIILDMTFYRSQLPVIAVLACLAVLLIFTYWIEVAMLKTFSREADPGKTSRESLSSMLTFLERKSLVPVIAMAATQVLIFVSGILLYFHLIYGYLKHINLLGFFVFGTLCLIGVTTSLIINLSQIKYHIKHLRVCLSDLNENTLAMVAQNIEESRKQDATIKFLLGVAIIFGFVVILVLLKAIIT
jgi:hypothetical protein